MLIITGTGRSGTGMLARLFSGHHEFRVNWILEKYLIFEEPGRNPFGSFDARIEAVLDLHQGIDPAAFVDASNLYIHLLDAVWALNPYVRFVLAVRDGRDFVRSAISRGWHTRDSFDLLPPADSPYSGRWRDMSAVERAAWIWAWRNSKAISMLDRIPRECWRVIRVEDLDEDGLKDMEAFSGHRISNRNAVGENINANSVQNFPAPGAWSEKDKNGFEKIAGAMMSRLGYS